MVCCSDENGAIWLLLLVAGILQGGLAYWTDVLQHQKKTLSYL
jgi:hypothetical protein